MRLTLLIPVLVALVVSVGQGLGAEAPYALVVVPPQGGQMPALADVDFAQVATALGLKASGLKVKRGDVRAAIEERGGRLKPVPCQYDAKGPAEGEVVLEVPASTRSLRVRVYFTAAGPKWENPLPPSPVSVSRQGQAIVVNNGFAKVWHDPARQGGLPSKWQFLATGKVFEDFNNNDRVFHKELQGFHLRNCPDPRVEVVAQGPLRVVVRVTSRYCRQDGTRPESKPEAVYEYSYFAGLPYVLLRAKVTQAERFEWPELHVAEINFPGTDFTHWLTQREEGALVADEKSHRGAGWAAVVDGPQGPNVLGVISSRVIIYDGRGGYGTYVHGPWVRWGTKETSFELALYAAGDKQALARLTKTEPGGLRVVAVRVSTPGLERDLALLRTRRGREEGELWAWAAELLRRLSADDLVRGVRLAREASKAARAGRPVRRWLSRADWPFECVYSDQLAVALLRSKGRPVRLASLFDVGAGREMLAARRGPLWELRMVDEDGEEVAADADMAPQSCRRLANQQVLALRWLPLRELGKPDADKLVVDVKLGVEESKLILRMNLLNDTSLSLEEIAWPNLYLGPLGDRGDDDVLVQAFGPGRLSRNPYVTAVPAKALYPNGGMDMQMFALYDPAGGATIMCQDPVASAKCVECSSEQGGLRFTFRWPAADFTRPGNDFTPPGPTVVQLFRGDWYDAAMTYRSWVAREAQWWPQRGKPGRPDTPQWMRDLPLWVVASGRPEEVVPKVRAFREYMGVPCGVHWYNWHKIPFDNDYPHYFPTKPGFPEGVRELQKAGVRVMPYINGRLWDSDTPDFKTKALPWATKDLEGKYYIEIYGSGEKLVPMCPTSKLWQETVQGIVKRLVGPEYNVDGVYIDQVGAASPRLCYDPSHGHPLGGGHWWTTQGYWPMLSKLQADLARDFPDKMLTTECTAEPYVHVFDGYLSWHWQENNAVPLFPAVYGDKIRLFSRAYRYAGDKALVYHMKLAQQFVFGEQMGWLDPNIWKDEAIGPYMRRLGKIRWQLREYFRGRMLRPPTIVGPVDEVTGDWAWHGKTLVTMKAVQAGAFRAENGRVAVVVTNLSRKPQTFTLRLPVKEYGVGEKAPFVWLGEEGRVNRQPQRLAAGSVKMTLKAGEAYGLLLGAGER